MVNTLKLPNNYRLIEEEEMMYTEGGWSTQKVIENLSKAATVWYIGWAATNVAKFVRANWNLSFWQMVGKGFSVFGRFLFALPWWAKIGFGVVTTAAIWALGQYNVF